MQNNLKITILGLTASGKTTLAKKISQKTSVPVFHLDEIFWKQPGGIKQEQFVSELVSLLNNNTQWIIEGSMPRSKTLPLRIQEASIIILYDLPWWITLYRHIKRYFQYRNKPRPHMAGNYIQKYPLTFKEINHLIHYPYKDLYKIIDELGADKKIFIIKNTRDEQLVLDYFN
jgi:adenylate kinase family enzyme